MSSPREDYDDERSNTGESDGSSVNSSSRPWENYLLIRIPSPPPRPLSGGGVRRRRHRQRAISPTAPAADHHFARMPSPSIDPPKPTMSHKLEKMLGEKPSSNESAPLPQPLHKRVKLTAKRAWQTYNDTVLGAVHDKLQARRAQQGEKRRQAIKAQISRPIARPALDESDTRELIERRQDEGKKTQERGTLDSFMAGLVGPRPLSSSSSLSARKRISAKLSQATTDLFRRSTGDRNFLHRLSRTSAVRASSAAAAAAASSGPGSAEAPSPMDFVCAGVSERDTVQTSLRPHYNPSMTPTVSEWCFYCHHHPAVYESTGLCQRCSSVYHASVPEDESDGEKDASESGEDSPMDIPSAIVSPLFSERGSSRSEGGSSDSNMEMLRPTVYTPAGIGSSLVSSKTASAQTATTVMSSRFSEGSELGGVVPLLTSPVGSPHRKAQVMTSPTVPSSASTSLPKASLASSPSPTSNPFRSPSSPGATASFPSFSGFSSAHSASSRSFPSAATAGSAGSLDPTARWSTTSAVLADIAEEFSHTDEAGEEEESLNTTLDQSPRYRYMDKETMAALIGCKDEPERVDGVLRRQSKIRRATATAAAKARNGAAAAATTTTTTTTRRSRSTKKRATPTARTLTRFWSDIYMLTRTRSRTDRLMRAVDGLVEEQMAKEQMAKEEAKDEAKEEKEKSPGRLIGDELIQEQLTREKEVQDNEIVEWL